jgi:hypothetical protein
MANSAGVCDPAYFSYISSSSLVHDVMSFIPFEGPSNINVLISHVSLGHSFSRGFTTYRVDVAYSHIVQHAGSVTY